MSLVKMRGDQPRGPNGLLTAVASHRNGGVSGSTRSARALSIALAVCFILCAAWLTGLDKTVAGATNSLANITVDYPLNGSLFPPDMAAPTFQWRDPIESAVVWQIDVTFGDGSTALHMSSKGEGLKIGEIDQRCVSASNKLPTLTPEQAAAHTLKPD